MLRYHPLVQLLEIYYWPHLAPFLGDQEESGVETALRLRVVYLSNSTLLYQGGYFLLNQQALLC